MKQIKRILIQLLENGLIISISLMLIVVIIQVFARFLLPKAPSWTEEAARMFFIFSIALGGGLAIRNNAYVRLEWFLNKQSDKVKKYLKSSIHIFIFLLSVLITINTIDFIKVGNTETSPAMQIQMSYVFSSIFLLFFFIAIFSLESLWKTYKDNS